MFGSFHCIPRHCRFVTFLFPIHCYLKYRQALVIVQYSSERGQIQPNRIYYRTNNLREKDASKGDLRRASLRLPTTGQVGNEKHKTCHKRIGGLWEHRVIVGALCSRGWDLKPSPWFEFNRWSERAAWSNSGRSPDISITGNCVSRQGSAKRGSWTSRPWKFPWNRFVWSWSRGLGQPAHDSSVKWATSTPDHADIFHHWMSAPHFHRCRIALRPSTPQAASLWLQSLLVCKTKAWQERCHHKDPQTAIRKMSVPNHDRRGGCSHLPVTGRAQPFRGITSAYLPIGAKGQERENLGLLLPLWVQI